MRKYICTLVLCATLGAIATTWAEAPKPSIAPKSWELRFRYQDPQRVSVILPGSREPAVYWYMLYTVENPGDKEVDFYPQFDLVTDTLKVYSSASRVSPEAFAAIQRRSGDPLLLPPEKVSVGKLLCGKDRARHGVAIWSDFDPKAKAFRVYASGLSGEIARAKNPLYDSSKPDSEQNKRYFLLRKTLEIPYRLPSSESERSRAIPQRLPTEQKWIMR